ncbi:hypothetical protein ACRYGZ_08125 [Mycobacteroides abscessus]
MSGQHHHHHGGSAMSVSKGEETTMGVIKPDMKIKLKMEGNVNGHAFVIEGEGEGKPYDGTNTINLEVKEGAPLPFSYDILTTAFSYGNRAFTKYPDDIPNYFKQSFPEGYSWERTMTFEDKGIVKVKSDISMEEDSFIYEIHLKGENFPPQRPRDAEGDHRLGRLHREDVRARRRAEGRRQDEAAAGGRRPPPR